MRKYLDDIGVKDRPDTWCEDGDERQKRWKKQREMYGFDDRETWNLDFVFYLWLYERLKMFLDVTVIDLDFHRFEYNGKEYTQRQMIDMMIERLEFCFSKEYNSFNAEHVDYVLEIGKIWATVLPAMWW